MNKKKIFTHSVLAMTVAVGGLLSPVTKSVEASETCTITIDANKHTTKSKAQATGICEGWEEGYYVEGQFNITGLLNNPVTKNGQTFNINIPDVSGEHTLKVYTVAKNATAPVVTRPIIKAPVVKAPVASKKTFTTKASLNVRSTSSASGKVLTSIPKGKKITSTHVQNGWYKVTYDNKTGWVSGSYLTEVKAPVASKPVTKAPVVSKKTFTTKASLNVRSTSSVSGKKLTTIPKGKKVTSTHVQNGWYKVTYNKKTGWVSGSYLTEVKKAPAKKPVTKAPAVKKTTFKTTANLNVRSTNSAKGKWLTTIPKGKTVTSSVSNNGWYKVTYNKKTGWVSGKYLKKA